MQNKIATKNVKTFIWTTGIPMIISMVLQALYNIIDTAFVINKEAMHFKLSSTAKIII